LIFELDSCVSILLWRAPLCSSPRTNMHVHSLLIGTESTMFWSPAKISLLWRFTDLLLHQWAVMPQQFSLPKPLLLHNLIKNFLLVKCLCDVSLEDCCCPNWLWSGA
jgi:hypothetical protein